MSSIPYHNVEKKTYIMLYLYIKIRDYLDFTKYRHSMLLMSHNLLIKLKINLVRAVPD